MLKSQLVVLWLNISLRIFGKIKLWYSYKYKDCSLKAVTLNVAFAITFSAQIHWVLNKCFSSLPVFKSYKLIVKKTIRVVNQNRGKHINYKRKTKEQQEH